MAQPQIMPANFGLREVANRPLTSPKFIKTNSAMGSIYILSVDRLNVMDFKFVNCQALLGGEDRGTQVTRVCRAHVFLGYVRWPSG